MPNQLANQFFSNDSFMSVAGASAIVFVVCNSLQSAFNVNPRWLALAVAEIVAFYGTYSFHSAHVPSDYFISALNGCLIYCTALGGTRVAASARAQARRKGIATPIENTNRRTFTSDWF